MMKKLTITAASAALGAFLFAGQLTSAQKTAGKTVAAKAGAQAGGAAKGDSAKGKEVFTQCSGCHNADTAEDKMGPTLQGLFKRKTMKSGKPMNDANVMEQINNGRGQMPPYGDQLSPEEKANLMAYLHTL